MVVVLISSIAMVYNFFYVKHLFQKCDFNHGGMTGEGKNKNQKLGVAAVTIHDLWEK
jgi:hypothetical protein